MVKHPSTSMDILPEANANGHIEKSDIYHDPLSELGHLLKKNNSIVIALLSGLGFTGGDN